MSDQGHRNSLQSSHNAAERRPLTPDELKQFDAMLGISRGDGPTLTRRDQIRPSDRSRMLQTVLVLIILAAIVATAFLMFR